MIIGLLNCFITKIPFGINIPIDYESRASTDKIIYIFSQAKQQSSTFFGCYLLICEKTLTQVVKLKKKTTMPRTLTVFEA